jgi:hypothetical protein
MSNARTNALLESKYLVHSYNCSIPNCLDSPAGESFLSSVAAGVDGAAAVVVAAAVAAAAGEVAVAASFLPAGVAAAAAACSLSSFSFLSAVPAATRRSTSRKKATALPTAPPSR